MKSLFSYGLNVFDEFLWHMINALVWLKKANDESPDNVKSIIELYPPRDEKTEIHHYLDKTELKLYNDIYHNAFSSFYTDHYDDGYHLDFSCRHPFFSETAYNFSLSHIVKDVPSDLFDDCCAWLNYIKNDSILYPDGLLEFAFTKYPENILLLVCNGPYKGSVAVIYQYEELTLHKKSLKEALCFEVAMILDSFLRSEITNRQLPKQLSYYFAEYVL